MDGRGRIGDNLNTEHVAARRFGLFIIIVYTLTRFKFARGYYRPGPNKNIGRAKRVRKHQGTFRQCLRPGNVTLGRPLFTLRVVPVDDVR